MGVAGVVRVLAHIGMVAGDDSPASMVIPARANRSTWVRAPRGGIIHRSRGSGDSVREGEALASVSGLFGEDALAIVSPIDGIIIGHGTLPVVNQGDAIFHIAGSFRMAHAGERVTSITEAIRASEPGGVAEPMLDEDEVL